MPEKLSDRTIFSLLEVTKSIQRTLSDRYKSTFWVKAEMNKLNLYPQSGHCYPELVEKRDGRVIAQIRASLWRDDYARANERFLSTLKEPLRDGITILFSAAISFDPVYGLTLRIVEIDPVFSLGELERERLQAINKLKEEGVYESNKRKVLPLLPKCIAVISVETSKGYADYRKVLDQNQWGYKVCNVLFPSILQGEKAVKTMRQQLARIRQHIKHFDAVAIVRGGGGDVGLSSFNDYDLARDVATFPIPVFTGIGHSTNETVVEMVSYRNAITPTELADFIIQKFHDVANPLTRAEQLITEFARRKIADEQRALSNAVKYFQSVTRNNLIRSDHALNVCSSRVVSQSRFMLQQQEEALARSVSHIKKASTWAITTAKTDLLNERNRLKLHALQFVKMSHLEIAQKEQHVALLDPKNILKRGFSITLNKDGKAVKHFSELMPGDVVTTILADGKIDSIVSSTDNKQQSDE